MLLRMPVFSGISNIYDVSAVRSSAGELTEYLWTLLERK